MEEVRRPQGERVVFGPNVNQNKPAKSPSGYINNPPS